MSIQKQTILLFFIQIIILSGACHTSKQITGQVESLDIDTVSEYFKLSDTISLIIIEYVGGCSCGVLSCASHCIGITEQHDTIRVLSFCNPDTTLKKGMVVKVIPEPIPKRHPDFIELEWEIVDGRMYISELFKKKLKTTYGKLVRYP